MTGIDPSKRHLFVGASEIPAILRLSKYPSLKKLAESKQTGEPLPDIGALPIVAFGREYEATIAEKVATMKPSWTITEPSETEAHMQHPKIGRFAASPDRMLVFEDGTRGVLEIKTTGATLQSADKIDRVPIAYWYQLQAQMMCGGFERGAIAIFERSSCELKIYEVAFNADAAEEIEEAVRAFWLCIDQNLPLPKPNKDDSHKETIRISPEDEEGINMAMLIFKLDARVKAGAEAKKERDSLLTRLSERHGDVDVIETPSGGRITRTVVEEKEDTTITADMVGGVLRKGSARHVRFRVSE